MGVAQALRSQKPNKLRERREQAIQLAIEVRRTLARAREALGGRRGVAAASALVDLRTR